MGVRFAFLWLACVSRHCYEVKGSNVPQTDSIDFVQVALDSTSRAVNQRVSLESSYDYDYEYDYPTDGFQPFAGSRHHGRADPPLERCKVVPADGSRRYHGKGDPSCPCVYAVCMDHLVNKETGCMELAALGEKKKVPCYDPEYGDNVCVKHDEYLAPYCGAQGSGGEKSLLPTGWDDGAFTPPDWCTKPWCYIDPDNCNAKFEPKNSSFSPQINGKNVTLMYSYETCGASADAFLTSFAIEDAEDELEKIASGVDYGGDYGGDDYGGDGYGGDCDENDYGGCTTWLR